MLEHFARTKTNSGFVTSSEATMMATQGSTAAQIRFMVGPSGSVGSNLTW